MIKKLLVKNQRIIIILGIEGGLLTEEAGCTILIMTVVNRGGLLTESNNFFI
jgi:hypothetical protein